MAYVKTRTGGGSTRQLLETTLSDFTISANSSVTKSITSGAKIIAVYGAVTYSSSYYIMANPVHNAVQVGDSNAWRDSTTLSATFSENSFTISNTSSACTIKGVKVLYEI